MIGWQGFFQYNRRLQGPLIIWSFKFSAHTPSLPDTLSDKLLDKAIDTIESAELLLDHEKTDVAAGRAYYALFYIAEALLNENGLQFSKHGYVIGAYGKEFSKTKLLDQKFHRWLIEGFDTRLIGDYHVDTKIEMDTI
ncbi:MAG: HEPN domain-containing protein, partial [Chloroflexi bacterium]|nr:HEPN domain-containing protein [Chloroflexota bacterium]